MVNGSSKITLDQLSRRGIVYVRQSTARQVKENEESTLRQYNLKSKLIELGWAPECIEVIDCDLGISGKFSENREGFQKLVSDVANGIVGGIASIEASRLSRSNADWAKLIEFCALTSVIIIDEDGIYDPADPNDRLLLGMKASITEMELHYIRARMQGGLINKAARGDLRLRLPVGYIYNPLNQIVFDPNKDVQQAVLLLFNIFRKKQSVNATVHHFTDHNLTFPVVYKSGDRKGETGWEPLTQARAHSVLTNPIYCGKYIFGQQKVVTTPTKRTVVTKPVDQWIANISNHHPGYITEEEFERNQRILKDNGACWKGVTDTTTVPGHGTALLQGIVYCGKCGRRMNTYYQKSAAHDPTPAFPIYICDGDIKFGTHNKCMYVNGFAIDRKIESRVRMYFSEEAVLNAVQIKEEADSRWKENESLLHLQVERAKYECALMKKRYMNCDPENALVRIDLEKAYNETLAAVIDAEKRYEDEVQKHSVISKEEMLKRLDNVVTNFGCVWDDPSTDIQVKKKLVRHLIQSVTILREGLDHTCKVQIMYTGGDTEEFVTVCSFYNQPFDTWKTYDYLVENGILYRASVLAENLNQLGYSRKCGKPWTIKAVSDYMNVHRIKTMKQHYLENGYVTTATAAAIIGISQPALLARIEKGWYDGHYVLANDHLYLIDAAVLNRKE